jgi:hypothetical protein
MSEDINNYKTNLNQLYQLGLEDEEGDSDEWFLWFFIR